MTYMTNMTNSSNCFDGLNAHDKMYPQSRGYILPVGFMTSVRVLV